MLTRRLVIQQIVPFMALAAWMAAPIVPIHAQAPGTTVRFDVNDVSFLWPVARTKAEAEALIAMDEKLPNGENVWSADLFTQVVTAAEKIETKASDERVVHIGFPDPAAFKDAHTWKVVGIRVNPSALGITDDSIKQFGSLPGIRLIVQPVTLAGDVAKPHDFAAHLAFMFLLPRPDGKRFPALPDETAFKEIVDDLTKIKALVEASHAPTAEEREMGVHPGFKLVPDFGKRLRDFVFKHVSRQHLFAISFMGLERPEPWIFFPVRSQTDGTFLPGEGQMLTFRGGSPVFPAKAGEVSTALLFDKDDDDDAVKARLSDRAFPATTNPELKELKVGEVADRIANPKFHHTLNTDCVSCHTETTRRQDLKLPAAAAEIAYRRPDGISGVAKSVLPKDKWNVRNFGWGLNFFEPDPSKKFAPTVSQRAANEAADSAQFINQHYLK